MIDGDTAFNVLSNDQRTYHLTGSRYFGVAKRDADYDFFVQIDSGIESYLEQNGFTLEFGAGSYSDPLVCSCWAKDNIHIQVVKNAQLKSRVQVFLKKHNLCPADKTIAKWVWPAVIIAFQELNG